MYLIYAWQNLFVNLPRKIHIFKIQCKSIKWKYKADVWSHPAIKALHLHKTPSLKLSCLLELASCPTHPPTYPPSGTYTRFAWVWIWRCPQATRVLAVTLQQFQAGWKSKQLQQLVMIKTASVEADINDACWSNRSSVQNITAEQPSSLCTSQCVEKCM